MNLHRDTPPDTAETGWDVGPYWIGEGNVSGVRQLNTPGGEPTSDLETFYVACETAAARLWGPNWQRPMARLFDLGDATWRGWRKSGSIPPPRIVAWLAFLSSRPNPRALGMLINGLGLGGDPDTAKAAWDQCATRSETPSR